MNKRKNWTNKEVAHLLESVKAAYIVGKENRFKIAAYDNAAAAIRHAGSNIKDIWEDGKLQDLPGIGSSIASHLDELFRTGKVKHFKQIFKKLPEAMFELIKVPGIGPKLAYKLCKNLGINRRENALKRLKQAAKQGKIRKMEGFGEKSEQEILEGLGEFSRRTQRVLLVLAENISQEIVIYLKKCPEVKRVDVLGSLRRKCPTVGDIDIAAASEKSEVVVKWFVKYPKKTKLVEAGGKKARILVGEYQIDLMVEPPSSYGSLLQHFTGSKQHNIHLREMALEKGLSLSEHGIRKLKVNPPAGGEKLKVKRFKDEKDFYNFLGMEWIAPELREDEGEIEAALLRQPADQGKQSKLPRLVELKDIRGDLQMHSSFDIEPSHDLGEDRIETMAKKGRSLGYEYIACTEHNPSISNHNEKQIIDIIKRKKDKIDKLNYSSNKNTRNKLFIFNSLEIDIRPNGQLAFPEKAFDYLDFALVSIHSSFRLEKNKMTERILKGLEYPKVKILAHPTGRILGKRESYELDWDKIFDFCKKNHKFLEINAYPNRLDLPDYLIKEAIKNGVKLSLGTDSHAVEQMELMKYGVYNARRGWATKSSIINSLNYDKIKMLLLN